MKQKTITLTYDEVWTLYTEARVNDIRFWEKDWEGNPMTDLTDFDKDLMKLYEKLEKKYGWTG